MNTESGMKSESTIEDEIRKLFAEELPGIGVETERNIYAASWDVLWPYAPRVHVEGPRVVQFNGYRAVTRWSSEVLNRLVEYGGIGRLREAVLGCRVQEQVAILEAELNEAVDRMSSKS